MRSLLSLCLALCVCVVAMGDQTLTVTITKIDGENVTVQTSKFNPETKKLETGDAVTLKAAAKLEVFKGKRNAETKKTEAGDPIEGGLKAEALKNIGEKGVRATIVTDGPEAEKAPKGTIKKIILSGGKGGFGGGK